MTSENNSDTVEFKPVCALEKQNPNVGERQLYA